jgi:hypothetical protein
MCMQLNAVRPYQKWRWAGDEIVFDARVPAARYVPGSRKKNYPMDIRGYLIGLHNAVLQAWIDRIYIERLVDDERSAFVSHGPGAYDFRVRKVLDSLGELRYIKSQRRFDQWLFPEETLAQGGGDCEDLAFLVAALLEESGVSRHCIRVALGSLVDHADPAKPKPHDHAWVVYQTEGGGWQLIEPLALVDRYGVTASVSKVKPARHEDVEYVPYFVFNRDHLWRVRTPQRRYREDDFQDYVAQRRTFWTGFDPSFAAKIHNDIFDDALRGMAKDDLQTVKLQSFWVDTNILAYDPRDHFDFAYIDESWSRVESRLKDKSAQRLQRFALAAHAIADFYAHSMYAHYAPQKAGGNAIEIYDPGTPLAINNDFVFDKFDLPGCARSKQQAKAQWSTKLISGQWWRWFTSYPDDIQTQQELGPRRCLPDHDCLAVDSPSPHQAPHLYEDSTEYRRQFALRRGAAIEHVRKAYQQWNA